MRPSKGNSCAKTRHTTYRSLRSVHQFFCTARPFIHAPTRKISYALQCISVDQTPLKVPLPVQASTSYVVHVPWTHPTQHFKLHLDRFSRFWTAQGTESLCFTTCVKTSLTRDWLWVAQYLIRKKVRQIYCGTLMYLCLACLVKIFRSFVLFYFSLPVWWIRINI